MAGMMDRRAFLASVSASALARRAAAAAIPFSGQRRIAFNDGWRFFKGEAEGAEQPAFSDARWTEVRLPHDWAIDGPFDSHLNPHTGALPFFGTGWYRKSFSLPESARDRYFAIEFDGAMSNARVWLNGRMLGERPYGYIGFSFDLNEHLHFGGENVLAVRLTPEDHSSRWYPGAGIYRNVWLDITGPVHVGRWGTYVTTPKVTNEKAAVTVKTVLRNRLDRARRVALRSSIQDSAGRKVAQATHDVTIPAASESRRCL